MWSLVFGMYLYCSLDSVLDSKGASLRRAPFVSLVCLSLIDLGVWSFFSVSVCVHFVTLFQMVLVRFSSRSRSSSELTSRSRSEFLNAKIYFNHSIQRPTVSKQPDAAVLPQTRGNKSWHWMCFSWADTVAYLGLLPSKAEHILPPLLLALFNHSIYNLHNNMYRDYRREWELWENQQKMNINECKC